MTVMELIEKLRKIEDKSKFVIFYHNGSNVNVQEYPNYVLLY